MNSIYHNFLLLIKQGLKSLDTKESVTSLKQALRLFNRMTKEKGWDEVHNLSDFLTQLTIVKASELFDECEIKEAILTSSLKLSRELNEGLEEIHVYEKQQEMMKKVLVKIRSEIAEMDDKEYRYKLIRTFVSENYLVDLQKIDQCLKRKISNDLLNDVKEMFVPWNNIQEKVTCCPVCHRVVEGSQCNEICHYYIKRKTLSFYQRELQAKSKYFYLCEGIYRYTLMPAIGELHIYNQLISRISEEGDVHLYPNVDEYDIEVQLNDKTYRLDVKDYKDPMALVQHFKDDYPADKMVNQSNIRTYVVIPNHRIDIYDKGINLSYLRDVKQLFKNLTPGIKVISEKELYQMIEEELENER